MEKDQPNYFAIIPADVRYANIPGIAKLLYAEITALCNKKGFCWATNGYFANLYKVSERTVQRALVVLQDNNFIKVSFDTSGATNSRKIYIVGVTKLSWGGDKIVIGGGDKIVIHNNTSINSKVNNTNTISKTGNVIPVLEYFNLKFSKKYRLTKDREKKIVLRLKTYSLEECKTAIDNLSTSKFHNGENDRGWVADVDFLFRSDEQVDKFLNFAPNTDNHYRNFNEF
jgi:uncharacterized phage protein (TIGR02220 family)